MLRRYVLASRPGKNLLAANVRRLATEDVSSTLGSKNKTVIGDSATTATTTTTVDATGKKTTSFFSVTTIKETWHGLDQRTRFVMLLSVGCTGWTPPKLACFEKRISVELFEKILVIVLAL
jgi:hypothetical protein